MTKIKTAVKAVTVAPSLNLELVEAFKLYENSKQAFFAVLAVECMKAGVDRTGKAIKAFIMDAMEFPKERAENIMIVDLVRNDLSKTAIKGSVKVIDLCKVYSFKQVHQLVSTVVSKVDKKTNSVDIIKSLFPMGSMTGAPKISAMEIIEELEETKRGLYSGAVGYFTSNGDFDFNVVIRSILYNESNKYISFTVGGAITAQSKIENEYDECLTKAEAMKKALNNNLVFNK